MLAEHEVMVKKLSDFRERYKAEDSASTAALLTRAAEGETRRQYPCSPPVPWNGGFEN
jgi:hypothetical protein